jgi:hypothetical protein
MLVQEDFANRESDGSAIIYNNEYNPVHIVPRPGAAIDNHEFYLKEPLKALLVTHRDDEMTLADFGHPEIVIGIRTNGFIELDISTGAYLFEWHSSGHITLDESFVMNPWEINTDTDYLHLNSVDKNKNGDYLISARHTNAIYLISGQDGLPIHRPTQRPFHVRERNPHDDIIPRQRRQLPRCERTYFLGYVHRTRPHDNESQSPE